MLKISLPICLLLTLVGCSTKTQPLTLGDIDIMGNHTSNINTSTTPKSNVEIRKAYEKYLKHSAKNDKSRSTAINRLAELEFELANKAMPNNDLADETSEAEIDAAYIDRLNKTIELITFSLQKYPNIQGNDKLLYNLANAYDQKTESTKSFAALNEIVNKYPKSRYHLESQFRTAEHYYSKGDYSFAEDAYSNVIFAKKNNRFTEKALLKRGWSKFKLEYYHEAIDDFLATVDYHDFGKPHQLSPIEEDIFNEYFRAIALSFSHLGDTSEISHYFKNKPHFKYTYQIYSSISNIYFKQNRYTDSAETLVYFASQHPASNYIPQSKISVINTWQQAGFFKKMYGAIDSFYSAYNPGSHYWAAATPEEKNKISHSLKEYILLMTKHFHNKYQTTQNEPEFKNAKKWYQYYLNDYPQHSRKDNIHFLYAELLSQHNNFKEALHHYEIAAYDTNIILNKSAAYSTILITSQLHQNNQAATTESKWLNQHIQYTMLYSQLYPNDKHTHKIMAHAAELAFNGKHYDKAIELAMFISDKASSSFTQTMNNIRAQSYLELKQYKNTENIYLEILNSANPAYIRQQNIKDKIAFSIYQQGITSKNNKDTLEAIHNFRRIAQIAPESDIASAGMNEATNLSISNEMWEKSIHIIKEFQMLFPNHDLNHDMRKKLSLAYMKSGQNIAAAQEYEKLSQTNDTPEIKTAALWKAAELYESSNEDLLAIKAYSKFAETYLASYSQHMEAMHKLVTLYSKINLPDSTDIWLHKILLTDKSGARNAKTARTKYIASLAALSLARNEYKVYKQLTLTLPLKKSLRKKKIALQQAVRLFGQASVYGIAETTTEATHSIAVIYNTFSQALLNSDRPHELNDDELEQYEILLEDQAFPFEEKAIEFFEANLARIKTGLYDSWIHQSHIQLKLLYPAKYQRKVKVDAYINVLH